MHEGLVGCSHPSKFPIRTLRGRHSSVRQRRPVQRNNLGAASFRVWGKDWIWGFRLGVAGFQDLGFRVQGLATRNLEPEFVAEERSAAAETATKEAPCNPPILITWAWGGFRVQGLGRWRRFFCPSHPCAT